MNITFFVSAIKTRSTTNTTTVKRLDLAGPEEGGRGQTGGNRVHHHQRCGPGLGGAQTHIQRKPVLKLSSSRSAKDVTGV